MLVDNLIPLITSTKARVPPSMEETIPIFHTEKTSSTTSIYHLRFLPVHPRKNVKYVELHVDSILNERYRIEPQNRVGDINRGGKAKNLTQTQIEH